MERMIIVSVISISVATVISVLICILPSIIKALIEYSHDRAIRDIKNKTESIEQRMLDIEFWRRHDCVDFEGYVKQKLFSIENRLALTNSNKEEE